MYEIFTLGGGTYLVDLLNAVAAITSGGAYVTLAQLAGAAGLAWVLFRTAFGGSWKDNGKWILMFVAVWGAMIVPKATVRVVDRLDPALAPAVVADVPIGLALFASVTSEIGDGLTQLTEQAFALPNDLAYRRHGMIFGARLAAEATRLEVTDAVFARNLRDYARQCVFYALLLGTCPPTICGSPRTCGRWSPPQAVRRRRAPRLRAWSSSRREIRQAGWTARS